MANEKPAELTEPCVGAFHYPAAKIAPQFASVFVSSFLVVLPVRHNQLDAALLQAPTQRVGIIAPVRNYALGLLPWAAFRSRDADFGERGFRKRNFCRRGTFQPNSSGRP